MLYIFRYFKEIQISIFVIETMFEIFLIGTCDNVREDISYPVSSFLFCQTKAALLVLPACVSVSSVPPSQARWSRSERDA